jgi:hypothetical protein
MKQSSSLFPQESKLQLPLHYHTKWRGCHLNVFFNLFCRKKQKKLWKEREARRFGLRLTKPIPVKHERIWAKEVLRLKTIFPDALIETFVNEKRAYMSVEVFGSDLMTMERELLSIHEVCRANVLGAIDMALDAISLPNIPAQPKLPVEW